MSVNKNKAIAAAQKFVQKGQLDKAIKELQRLVDEDPKDVRTLLKIGDLYTKKGDRREAAQSYMKVAQFYSDQGFYLKAVAVYKQILRVDQNILEVHVKLAELYHQLGLISEAMTQFQQVVAFHESKGQIQESLAVLQKMVDLDPDNVASRIKLAELCSSQGMVAEAVHEFESASSFLKAQQRLDDYVKVAERLVFHDPNRREVLHDLAQIYLDRGDTKRALAKLQICFKNDPRDVVTLRLLAHSFAALGQIQKTVSVYKELAKIHEEEGRPADSEKAWQTIAEIAPDDADLQVRRGGGRPPQPGPISMPSISGPVPVATGVTRAGPAAAAPVAVAPVAVAPAARPQAPPSAAGNPLEAAAKLLTETDVYVKYGLKERALEHLKKIFDLIPDYEPAYAKQKSIALAMGDRNLAARAIEQLVRVALARGDQATASGHVSELEGLLPGYAGLPALRAALVGGPAPAAMMASEESFDEVSVEIALSSEEEVAAPSPRAPARMSEPPPAAVEELEEVVSEDAVLEELPSHGEDYAEYGADDLDLAAQSLMDEAVRSVVTDELEELPEEDAGLELPDEPLVGGPLQAPTATGEQASRAIERAMQPTPPGFDEGFDDSLPTKMLQASEVARYHQERAAGVAESAEDALDEAAEVGDALLDAGDEIEAAADDELAVVPTADDVVMAEDGGFIDAVESGGFDEAGDILPDFEPGVGAASDFELLEELPTGDVQKGVGAIAPEPVKPPPPPPVKPPPLAPPVKPPPLQGSTARPDADAALSRAIAAAGGSFNERSTLEQDVGVGTATEIMGLSDEELAEIRAFASGGTRQAGAGPWVEPSVEPAALPVLPAIADTTDHSAGLDRGEVERDPASDFFPDEFNEADFFMRQGLYEEARDILQAILDDVPESWRARAMLDQVQSLEAGEELAGGDDGVAASAPAAGGDDSFDLAAELDSELGDFAPAAAAEDFQYTVDEVFQEFKKGVAKTVDANDADTHYDLGIAYKEMGLVEDAINEFKVATSNPRKAPDAFYMMSLCHIELGRNTEAINRLKDALNSEGISSAQETACLFELGQVYQRIEDPQEALYYFKKVLKKDPKFQDVSDRVAALETGGGRPGGGGGGAAKKNKNVSFL
ncbi:MAG: tetratricopeptide repeat protein [Deltaproteobacteria bacterium]|nr:tetratricopeptide repeat protein [Deltaproteobacteria bacterium]